MANPVLVQDNRSGYMKLVWAGSRRRNKVVDINHVEVLLTGRSLEATWVQGIVMLRKSR